MMKPVHLFTLSILFVLTLATQSRAQLNQAFINGPAVVCLGECATYFVENLSPNCPGFGFWFLDNGTSVGVPGGTTNSVTICWDSIIGNQPGTYTLFVQFDCSDQVEPLSVQVVEFFQPEIISLTNSSCAQDSLIDTDCRQVCAFSTVTYTVNSSSNPAGGGVFWTFSGAESYEVDGNFLTITWGAAGTGFVSVFVEGNLCSGENSICIEILEDPVADFSTQPPPIGDTVTICQGQSVFFENLSQGAVQYAWYFDMLGISTQTDPEFVFQNPGTYEVRLLARNECGCSDTTSMIIQVEAADTPAIDCTGGVCTGETVTYTTSANCSAFGWNVTGSANILGGGGPNDNFITIEWLDGPYGYIELDVSACSGNYCSSTLVERIPVMGPNVVIEGPQKVCRDETELYRVPEFDGSSYTWSVSPQGQILAGQGTNEILVRWSGPLTNGLTEWVQVEYDNCFLECTGSGLLPVGVLNEFYLSGPIVVCEGETAIYEANNVDSPGGTIWNWEVQTPAGAVLWSSASAPASQAINWTYGPGKYLVVGTPANPDLYCTDRYQIVVDVKPLPTPPAVDGPALICPGTPYAYAISSGQPNGIFHWTINDGGAVYTEEGASVVVTWGPAPPYELEVTQSSASGPNCPSAPVGLAAQALSGLTLSGPPESCVETTSVFTTDDTGADDYEWTILPAGAGTIISGDGTATVEVLWHTAGAATVEVSLCGQSASAGMTIHPRPEPDPLFPVGICTGSAVQVNTQTAFATYQWLDENGVLLSTAPDPQLVPGTYEVVVTNALGCEGNGSFVIEEFPIPEIFISTPDPTGYCTGHPPATLYATTTGAGFSYQWFYQGNPVGTNSVSLVDMGYGDYWAEATDVNGCTTVSNTLVVFEYCPPGGGTSGGGGGLPGGGGGGIPTDCEPGTSVQFQILPPTPDCAEGIFEDISPDVVPGSLSWDFGDGTSSTDQGPQVTHFYSQAGYYDVTLAGTSASTGDICWDSHIFTVSAAADFYAAPVCAGQTLQFEDRSTFLPTTSIVAWDWDFGDGNTSTLSSPIHTFTAAGTYNVTLTITAQSGCQSSIIRSVEVYAPPAVAFDLPSVTCEGTPLPFAATVPSNVIDVAWDFGDPASGGANEAAGFSTYHDFSSPGSYDVQLTATSVYGCTDSLTQSMVTTPNGLSGDIAFLPDPPLVCEGDTVSLIAPAGGVAWLWSDGQTTGTIDVLVEAVYQVTLTDAQGCQHVPDPVSVDIVPGPNAVISAVEYNEYGQPVGIFYNAYSVCEGEGVYLQVEGAPGFTYTWSNGETGTTVVFADWRNNPLPVGTHGITVEVADPASGCTSVVGPFQVTVNGIPDVFQITASNQPACAGQPTELSVLSPDPGLSYVWTTGQTGASIEVVLPGIYNVAAINANGCRRDSDTPLTVEPGPYLGAIPSGCHTQCNPDTICIPELPNVVSYQWYFNGSPLPGPEGTTADLPVSQSGTYYVEMVDVLGCTAASDPLQLDLYDGYGTILGNVYMDINQNGLIDGPDTLVLGIGVELLENGILTGTTSSGAGGAYSFPNILSTNYTVQLDTTTFPEGTTYYLSWQEPAGLVGCDDEAVLHWLLSPSCETFDTLILIACEGDSAEYNGNWYPGGFTGDFLFANTAGCDSTVTVIVEEIPAMQGAVTLIGCEGDVVIFDSIPLPSPSFVIFEYVDQYGCDSLIAVTVLHVKVDTTEIFIPVCQGEFYEYEGEQYPVDSILVFVLESYQACDSIVRVAADPYVSVPDSIFYNSCNGDPVDHNGVLIWGSDTTLVYSSVGDCDSLVHISVSEGVVDTTLVELGACTGQTVEFQGDFLSPGGPYHYSYLNVFNCDSVVLVFVEEWFPDRDTLFFAACEGVPVIVDGTAVFPGDTVTMPPYQNAFGCDSLVTVIVEAWPSWATEDTLAACAGELVPYHDTLLLAGTQTVVALSTFQECDSLVTVTVLAFPVDTAELFFEVCPGETISYFGRVLGPGDQDSVLFSSVNGCDSLVRVFVSGFPDIEWTYETGPSCWNVPTGSIAVDVTQGEGPFAVSLNGVEGGPLFEGLSPGVYTMQVVDANGCMQSGEAGIGEIPPLQAEVEAGPWDCKSGSALIRAAFSSGQGSIAWPDGSAGPFWNAPAPGSYTVQFDNECETLTREFEVVLAESDSGDPLYLPNIFSPNYDGINDVFRAYTAEDAVVEEYHLLVFDRWGNLLYETEELERGWDGKLGAEELDPGVYVYYVISKVRVCGVLKDVFKEGGITLIR